MMNALSRAFGQLGDPKVLWIILISLVITIGLMVGLWMLLNWLISDTKLFNWGILNWTVRMLGGIGVTYLVLLMFPIIMLVVSSCFLDFVVRAVEAKHYPYLPKQRDQSVGEIIWYIVVLLLISIGLNLLLLPFYFIPILSIVVAWTVNGYLMGRSYYDLVAQLRLEPAQVKQLRAQRGGRIFGTGFIIAALSTVPILNLVMPVVASAFMTHIFHEMIGNKPVTPA
ncbi:MAG: EI24 domain-containing protein [Alphaproteobacteria bacterium]